MSLCPEFARRAAMTDGEFWDHVYTFGGTPGPVDDDYPNADVEMRREPCPECGEAGACAWDAEGRPMIHATPAEPTGDRP